jgi:hypothetical protein
MIRAIVIKELRELRRLAAVGLVAYALVVASLSGVPLLSFLFLVYSDFDIPFADERFHVLFILVSVPLAVALGLRQSLGEARGTWLFLLHRPIERDMIFLLKLATGCGVFLLCAAAPIVGYALWSSLPGHHASPFEWSMTMLAWRIWLVLPIVYLGAFLSGLRPARWFATRLLPLMGCGVAVICVLYMTSWMLLGLPLTVVLYAGLIYVICHVARTRDYA